MRGEVFSFSLCHRHLAVGAQKKAIGPGFGGSVTCNRWRPGVKLDSKSSE